VTPDGNPTARALVDRFFAPADASWRGLGPIPGSGSTCRPEYAHRDAGRLAVEVPEPEEPEGCRCGEVLKGVIDPPECPLFATPARRSLRSARAWFERRGVRRLVPARAIAGAARESRQAADDLLAHGGGGRLTHELVAQAFLPAFRQPGARDAFRLGAAARAAARAGPP